MTKKLFLHIGIQKTGSSYLQHMLRVNSRRLHERGIAYRAFSNQYVSSGNGDAMLAEVRAMRALPDFERMLDRYFADCQTAIVSSELLYSTGLCPQGPGWQFLLQRLNECDIQVEVIAFFRNPVDYLRSAYSQSVRRHGFTEDFSRYIDEFSPDLYDGPLRQLVPAIETMGRNARLHVLEYESASRAGLWRVFVEICGLHVSDVFQEAARVNPALNASQLLLHRIHNEVRPDDESDFFSDLLIQNAVLADADPLGVTETEFAAIQARFSTAVEFVNQFVSGEPVKLSPPSSFSPGADELVMRSGDIARLMKPLLSDEYAMRILSRAFAQIREQCRIGDPDLKRRYPDFDPLAYLVWNPDLIQAKVDPYRHFDTHGRHEGRRYRLGD
jgi:hypothetical protein